MKILVKNQLTCPDCVKNALKFKWENEHAKSSAEKSLDKTKEKIYDGNDLKSGKDFRFEFNSVIHYIIGCHSSVIFFTLNSDMSSYFLPTVALSTTTTYASVI